MRLTHLRFANLNSLVGEWSIDFTHPDYLGNGIFAITGPTGSGKTTLLDAVCLALFGRTPRLPRISRSANDIMARQTGECFAEVTFETSQGSYRVHWSQHRARRKPDGELQTQKHELAEAISGKILETSLRGVGEQIERLIGMDFDRFTRSVLLAQGSFAAFLQATADERSPILEQITGTELYSQISVRVHELRQEQRSTLDALQAELKTLNVLDPDELAELEQRKRIQQQQDQELSSELHALGQAQQWLERIAKLQHDLHENRQAQHVLEQERTEFEPRRHQLLLAQNALEVMADHAALVAARKQLQQTSANQIQIEQDQQALSHQEQQAHDQLQHSAQQLKLAQERLQTRLPLLRQVGELDRTLNSLSSPLEHSRQALTELSTRIAQQQAGVDGVRAELASAQEQLNQLTVWLEEHAGDEALISELAALKERWADVQQLRRQALHEQNAARQAEQQWQAARGEKETLHARYLELDTRNTALESQRHEKLQARLATLGGNTLAELREREATQNAKQAIVKQVASLLDLIQGQQSTCQASKHAAAQAQATLAELHTQLALGQQRVQSSARELQLLETQYALEQRIASLEQLRLQLRDNEPCPLCGSREHPFADHGPEPADTTLGQLEQARRQYQDAQQELQNLLVHQAVARKEEQHANDQHDSAIREIERLQMQAQQLLPELQTQGAAEQQALYLQQELEHTAAALTSLNETLQQLQALDAELENCTQQQATLNAALDQARTQERDAREQVALRQQLVERSQRSSDQAQQLANRANNELLARLQAFRPAAGQAQEPESILSDLAQRAQSWSRNEQQRQELARRLPQLQTHLQHSEDLLQQTLLARNEQQQRLSDQEDKLRQLQAQRAALYGTQRPEDEERELTEAIDQLQSSHQGQATTLAGLRARLSSLTEQHHNLRTALKEQQHDLDQTSARFQRALSKQGFANEQQYLQACLDTQQRQALIQQAKQLDERHAFLLTRQQDTQKTLQSERDRQLWSDTPEQLQARQQEIAERSRQTQQALGAVYEQLRVHETQLALLQERAAAIQAQQEVCRQWDNLHELIGSADGKKYRNFAQGLTFDIMISHANRQLANMSDRYLLVRDTGQPLDLNVIDNHQGGQVRSTRNLSGGESFLVSLALALGLSAMSSRNVRVDSLFLDEGFGTLDEDALETALETLAGLHQDGKLIGVISHIPALKERIGVQLQVTPVRGGRSRLSGPGCLGPGQ